MKENAIVEVYLSKWGECMRKGWNVDLDCPHVAVFYQDAVSSPGAFVEPDYLDEVHQAVNSLKPSILFDVVEQTYRYNIKLKPLSKRLHMSYPMTREKLKIAEAGVHGYLRGIGLING